MTNQEMIERINLWQSSGLVLPLSCQRNSSHINLVAEERNAKVILVCQSCANIGDWIPDYLLTTYFEVIQTAMRKGEKPRYRPLLNGDIERTLASGRTCRLSLSGQDLLTITFSNEFNFADLKEAFESEFDLPIEKAEFSTEGYDESGSLDVRPKG